MKITKHWVSFAFCAFLSLLALGISIGYPNAWQSGFLGFLPMCFFYTGAVTTGMQKEIDELREQVTELRTQQAGALSSIE